MRGHLTRWQGHCGSGVAVSAAPPSPKLLMGGAYIYLEPSGITEAAGAVASWDSTGSDTTRFENSTAANRPTVTSSGSRIVAQFDGSNDYLTSAANLQIVKRAIVSCVLRVDTFATARQILNPANGVGALLRYQFSSVNTFAWENGGADAIGTTAVADGSWYAVVVDVQNNTGTVTVYINGASSGTATGTAVAPAAQTWSVGGTPTGTNAAAFTLADLAVWNGVTSPDLAGVHAWNDYVLSKVV